MMQCTIDGANARILAKAVQSLSKFGVDLFVECDKQGFQLRAVNPACSAVGTFRFRKTFFEHYILKARSATYCRITMKACLSVFRSMKYVEQCVMRIITDQSKFQIQLKCRFESVRNVLISFVDEENITATMPPNSTENVISGTCKIFGEISSNFNTVEEEITLELEKDHLTVKNYIEGSRVNDKFMRSQLRLAPDEFETYKVGQEATVTFCLKEFRAFLLFAEALNASMVLNFNESGSPIFVTITKFDQVECVLIMSTLSPEDVSLYDDCRVSEVLEPNLSVVQKRKIRDRSTERKELSKTARRINNDDTLSNDSSLFVFNSSKSETEDTNQSVLVARRITIRGASETNKDDNTMLVAGGRPISISDTPLSPHVESMITFCDTEDVNLIPQSPHIVPDGQLRSIFSRCFESTYVPENPSPSSQIYVPNSDTED